MRISDWSSDVCSSDLRSFSDQTASVRSTSSGCSESIHPLPRARAGAMPVRSCQRGPTSSMSPLAEAVQGTCGLSSNDHDRKSVVEVTRVPVRVVLGDHGVIKKKITYRLNKHNI